MSQAHPLLKVSLVTPKGVLFEAQTANVILPGVVGTLEVLPNHKPLMTCLKPGQILLEGRSFPVKRGIAKVALNQIVAIIEE